LWPRSTLACRTNATGVLILSELAGAASELGEALIVNPQDVSGMAQAIKIALEMPLDEQQRNVKAMRSRLRRYDVVRWADEFLTTLQTIHPRFEQRLLSNKMREKIVADFCSADRRLLLADYDGTLVPLRPTPEEARPDGELLALLSDLTKISDLMIVSGRPRATLDAWFGNLDVGLVAEHGIWVKERDGELTNPVGGKTDWNLESAI